MNEWEVTLHEDGNGAANCLHVVRARTRLTAELAAYTHHCAHCPGRRMPAFIAMLSRGQHGYIINPDWSPIRYWPVHPEHVKVRKTVLIPWKPKGRSKKNR